MAAKVVFEGKRELRWLMIAHCVVTYMEGDTEFADELWDQWLEALRRPSVRALMLCSWGPTKPSHQQWRRATRLMRDRDLPVAVVTDARHNLALAKAASWLGTDIESHRWTDLDAAIEKVQLVGQKVSAKAKIIALRDRFGAVVPQSKSEPAVEPELARPSSERSVVFDVEYETSDMLVLQNSEEIQRRLAEVQARFRSSSGPLAAKSQTKTND